MSSEGQLQGPNTSTLHGPSQVAGVYPPTLDRWDLGPRTPSPSLKAEFRPSLHHLPAWPQKLDQGCVCFVSIHNDHPTCDIFLGVIW